MGSRKAQGLFLGSTEVSAERSIQELMKLLAANGAQQIVTDFGPEGTITGMRFLIEASQGSLAFALPVRTEKLYSLLSEKRKSRGKAVEDRDRDRAQRIAWRQLVMWVKAQIALIDVGMASTYEVFFPYMLVGTKGETAYQQYQIAGGEAQRQLKGKS